MVTTDHHGDQSSLCTNEWPKRYLRYPELAGIRWREVNGRRGYGCVCGVPAPDWPRGRPTGEPAKFGGPVEGPPDKQFFVSLPFTEGRSAPRCKLSSTGSIFLATSAVTENGRSSALGASLPEPLSLALEKVFLSGPSSLSIRSCRTCHLDASGGQWTKPY